MADVCPPPALLPLPSVPSALACPTTPALLDPAEADWVLKLLSDTAAEQPIGRAQAGPRSSSSSTHFEHPLATPYALRSAPARATVSASDALRVAPHHQRRLRSIDAVRHPGHPIGMLPMTGRIFGRRVPPAARGIDDWWLDPTMRKGKELFLDPASGQVAYLPLPPARAPLYDSWSSLLWSCVPVPPMPPVPHFLLPLATQVGSIIPPALRGPAPPQEELKVAAPATPSILITPPEHEGTTPQHVATPRQDLSGSTLSVPMF